MHQNINNIEKQSQSMLLLCLTPGTTPMCMSISKAECEVNSASLKYGATNVITSVECEKQTQDYGLLASKYGGKEYLKCHTNI